MIFNVIFYLLRPNNAGKSRKKSVGRKRFRFARKCRSKNVGCIISKSATRWKLIKGDVRRFHFINPNVKMCQKRSVRQHTQKNVKQNIKKSEDIKISTNAYGLQQSPISLAHRKLSSFKTKLQQYGQLFMLAFFSDFGEHHLMDLLIVCDA